MSRYISRKTLGVAVLCMASLAVPDAQAQAARQFSFAYDQPTTTAYGIAANIFDAKLN